MTMSQDEECETGTMATVRILVAKAMMDNFYAEDGLKEKVKSNYNCKVKFISSSPECVAKIRGPLGQNLYSCISFLVPWLFGCKDGVDDGEEKDLRFLMHKSLSLKVIGEGANTIKNIKLASGANVLVHPKDAPHSTDRVVQVTGNLLEVIDATKLVYEAVADAEVEGEEKFYNPSKHDEFNVPDYGGFSKTFKLKKDDFFQASKVTSDETKDEETDEKIIKENLGFHDMELDERIQKSIAKIGWAKPTLIQEKGIPLILDGKDILARGRTGSGKTGAFAIPMIQRILNVKNNLDGSGSQCVRGIVLCPSRELAKQTALVMTQLAMNCTGIIRILDVGSKEVDIARPFLKDLPDIVVCTPGRLATHIREGNVDLKTSLEFLVIDEADLVFTFGFEKDIKYILENLPKVYQACLTSATLSEDVEKLKRLVLNNPVVLKLQESDLPESNVLTQYVLKLEQQDKATLIYALFKLQLIRGKTIIFVMTVDRCYKLKLFLEQFAIPCCVLNSELPAASRCHMVNQFNSGAFNILITADEKALENEEGLLVNKKGKILKKIDQDRLHSKRKKDSESGVVRGIDFQFVSNVINFDFPKSYDSYIHRVGRTARAGYNGTSLSLVSMKEHIYFEAIEEEMVKNGCSPLTPYQFNMKELDGLKYRATDAWGIASKNRIREARLKEIKREMTKSEKLKAYFEENPADQSLIKHDEKVEVTRHMRHMRNLPEYIIPTSLRKKNLTRMSLVEEIKVELEERLERANLSKEMLEDNKQETQMVLGELSHELAQIRMNMVKQNNICHIIKTQIQAANRMNELLSAYQERLKHLKENIPVGARKQNIHDNIQNKGQDAKSKKSPIEDPKDANDSSDDPKTPRVKVDQVEFISLSEFDTVPKYMKGRVQFATMNTAVEELNTALEEKYAFMARTFANMTSMTEKKKYKAYKSQESKTTTAGIQFITAEDLKGAQILKSEHSRRSLLPILRHLKKIKEIRGPETDIAYCRFFSAFPQSPHRALKPTQQQQLEIHTQSFVLQPWAKKVRNSLKPNRDN